MVLAFLLAAPGAWATDYHWIGAGTGGNTATDPADPTTQWAGAANWQEGSAPDASAVVYLPLTNAGSVHAATTTIDTLYVDGSTTGGFLCITDGVTLTTTRWMDVGETQLGKTVQSGGTCEFRLGLTLGSYANSSGFYELSGAAVLNTGTSGTSYGACIGGSGAGTFTQSGGTHTARNGLIVGFWGGSGTYDLSLGDLNVESSEVIGWGGAGTFIQTGGRHTVNEELWLGLTSGFPGSYSLSSGDLNVKADEYIGGPGGGTFTQTGGTHTVSGALYLGYGGYGTYNLSSGDLNASSDEYIGYVGAGTFTQTGGTHVVSSHIELGSYSPGTGTYDLGGGSLSVPTIYVGVGGRGVFHWTGGSLNVQDVEIGGTGSRFSVGLTAEFAGDLHANGGSVEVDADDTLTLLGEFGTTQEDKTITKEGAGVLRIEGPQAYAAGAILSVAEGTLFMDTAAGDATTHNLEVDVGGAGSDALIVFEADQYLPMLHILSGGTARLGNGCHVLVLDTLWIEGIGKFGNIRLTNVPEPATLALVGLGALALWRGRVKKRGTAALAPRSLRWW